MKSSARASRSSRPAISGRSAFGWSRAGCSTSATTAGSVPVVVVNESFVRRYLPNKDPIGSRILVERILPSRRGLGPLTAWEIVGVVVDEKASGLENPTDVGAYASFAQSPVVGLGLVAQGQRRSGDAHQVDPARRSGA